MTEERKRRQAGLSILEILIVLTLIGLTATFIGTKLLNNLEEGNVRAAKIQMNNLANVLKEYRRVAGRYPTTLESLVEKPEDWPERRSYPDGGFIDKERIPLDPWGSDYIYRYESGQSKFYLACMGKQGLEADESEYIVYGQD